MNLEKLVDIALGTLRFITGRGSDSWNSGFIRGVDHMMEMTTIELGREAQEYWAERRKEIVTEENEENND
jgi:hypothetical protein